MSDGLFYIVRVWMPLSDCHARNLKCLVLVHFTLRGVISVIKQDFSLHHVCVVLLKWDLRMTYKIGEHNRAIWMFSQAKHKWGESLRFYLINKFDNAGVRLQYSYDTIIAFFNRDFRIKTTLITTSKRDGHRHITLRNICKLVHSPTIALDELFWLFLRSLTHSLTSQTSLTHFTSLTHTHSLTHSLTHTSLHSLTHSLIYSLHTHFTSLNHSLTHSLNTPHSHTSFTHFTSLTHSLHSLHFTHSLTYSLTLTHSLTHSTQLNSTQLNSTHSLTQSINQ